MTASLMPNGKQQFFNASGAPLSGGKVYTYAAGTTTPKATYTTSAAAVQNANPVILDARGEASIFWTGSYNVAVKDANDVLIYSTDNYTPPADVFAASTGAGLIGWIQSGIGSVKRWIQDKLRESVSVEDFGAVAYDGTDATDATAAFQAAIDAVALAGGGTVKFFKRHLINGNLNIADTVSLRGPLGQPDELLPANAANYSALQGVLIVNPAATITVKDSASITNCIVVCKGLTLPFASAAAAATGVIAFSGTALTVGGAGAYFAHLLILGFATAIYGTGFERVRCSYVSGDCTNGIDIQACFDISYVDHCHFWPWTTTHQTWTFDIVAPNFLSAGSLLTRSGIAYRFKAGGDWNKWNNCFSFGYTGGGFVVDSCNNVNAVSCGSDYYGPLSPTVVGFNVIGDSQNTTLIGYQAAAQGTGVVMNSSATTGAELRMIGCSLRDNDIQHVSVLQGRAIINGNSFRGGAVGITGSGATPAAITAAHNDFDFVPQPWSLAAGGWLELAQIGKNTYTGCTNNLSERSVLTGSLPNQITTVYGGANGLVFQARYARGTPLAPTVSQINDSLLKLEGQPYDGANFISAAMLRASASGAQSVGSNPTSWIFSTTPAGSATRVDRIVIDQDGNLRGAFDNDVGLGTSAIWYKNAYIKDPVFKPAAAITPVSNGDMQFELTSNTQLKIKVKGSDGTVRSTSLVLA